MGQAALGAFDLAGACLAAELHHDLVDHGQAGRAAGVTPGNQAAIGVERDAATEGGVARVEELLALPFGAEAEQLVVLELLVGEGVVAEGQVHVVRAQAGILVGQPSGGGAHGGRTHHRTEEGVAGRVGLALEGGGDRAHQTPVGLVPPDPFAGGHDHTGGAVVGRAGHHGGERLGHHARRQHLVHRDGVVGLPVAQRVECAMVPVLGRNGGEVLRPGAVVVHPSLRPQSEVGGREDGGVELVTAGAAAPTSAASHVRHLVEGDGHGHLGPARGHRPRGLSERDEAGGRRVLDVGDGQPGEAELLHRLDADHGRRLDVPHEGLVHVGQGDAGIAQRRQPGVAGQLRGAAIRVSPEPHHPDPGDGRPLDLHAPPPTVTGLKR